MIKAGVIVTDEDGHRYIVRSVYAMDETERAYGLTSIPDGMSAHDLGRLFRPSPTLTAPQAFMLLIPTQGGKSDA